MGWLQAHLDTPREQVAAVEDLLLEAGAVAVTLQDSEDQPILEPGVGETPLWPEVTVTGLFDERIDGSQLLLFLMAHGPVQRPRSLRLETVGDQEWTRSWLDRFQPMRFGERLWVVPTHLEPPEPDAINLLLDPGLAFGTGTHPTTSLCLGWLDEAGVQGQEVLDYGCGSGILGIAAALCGATSVTAVDHDPQALVATRENARRNGVEAQISECLPADYQASEVDLVLANILAEPLIQLAPQLSSALRPGGWLVLSGLLESQAEAVMAAYRDSIEWQPARQEQEWVCLVGKRR